MGIINIVQNVKQIKKEDIIFVQVGNFYNCYGKDSYIISYLFNYKISVVENNICMVSFPKTAYNKVISKLENNKINYTILDKRNNYEENISNENKQKRWQKYASVIFSKTISFIDFQPHFNHVKDYARVKERNNK